jgi:hypothetical protein
MSPSNGWSRSNQGMGVTNFSRECISNIQRNCSGRLMVHAEFAAQSRSGIPARPRGVGGSARNGRLTAGRSARRQAAAGRLGCKAPMRPVCRRAGAPYAYSPSLLGCAYAKRTCRKVVKTACRCFLPAPPNRLACDFSCQERFAVLRDRLLPPEPVEGAGHTAGLARCGYVFEIS